VVTFDEQDWSLSDERQQADAELEKDALKEIARGNF
jgi:hypothetical protein